MRYSYHLCFEHVIFTDWRYRRSRCATWASYWPAFLQSGGKNAAGGDYSSCEYIGANHRHHGKTGEKQGKTPIVVRDKAGFYVNRILAPYINEAIRMLTEGERIEHIDTALVKFGFPVGPIQLLDEVGIDTGLKLCLYWKLLMENVLARLQMLFLQF